MSYLERDSLKKKNLTLKSLMKDGPRIGCDEELRLQANSWY